MTTHPAHTEKPLSALDVIFSRRSVRAYTGQRLDRATVGALLDAAVQAPTAIHLEPWTFVVVQDADTLKRISDLAKSLWTSEPHHARELHELDSELATRFAAEMADPAFDLFYGAGTLVVICGKSLGPFVEADCWLAAENLMLAGTAMGLGTCCIGSVAEAINTPVMKIELGIPPEVTAVAPVVVGVPREGEMTPVARKRPEILSWR